MRSSANYFLNVFLLLYQLHVFAAAYQGTAAGFGNLYLITADIASILFTDFLYRHFIHLL